MNSDMQVFGSINETCVVGRDVEREELVRVDAIGDATGEERFGEEEGEVWVVDLDGAEAGIVEGQKLGAIGGCEVGEVGGVGSVCGGGVGCSFCKSIDLAENPKIELDINIGCITACCCER